MFRRIAIIFIIIIFTACCCFIILSDNAAVYTLKEHNGKLALFKNKSLQETYDTVDVYSLPSADIETLKKGIVLNSPDDVWSYLEDYDG